ncbi:MAG: lipoprotein [Betaproteobacteria bacterium]|nr:lipoprotein [Betaproteobacteria bacterium]
MLRILILLVASTLILAACGQKGPLKLPPPTPTEAPKTDAGAAR